MLEGRMVEGQDNHTRGEISSEKKGSMAVHAAKSCIKNLFLNINSLFNANSMHIKQTKKNNPETGTPMGPGCKQMYYYVYPGSPTSPSKQQSYLILLYYAPGSLL
jgi:hypothetical protein